MAIVGASLAGMETIKTSSQDFADIEQLLAESRDSTELEMLAGIDCDAEDIEAQRESGEADPMVTIELIAQWHPGTREGILDWCYARESVIDDEEPVFEHGGSLLGFRYTSKSPDLDSLLESAVPLLNDAVEWVEFELGDEV